MRLNMHEMEVLHTMEKDGLTAKLFQDPNPTAPARADDDGKLGTLVMWHRNYCLEEDGRKVFGDPAEFLKQAKAGKWFYLPVSMLDHSGITLYEGTREHICDPGGWDSGQVGFIYCTPERARELFCVKRLMSKRVYENLRADLKEWDQYVTGDVYGYVIEDAEGNHHDSCWGFFGHEYAKAEMAAALDNAVKWEAEQENKIAQMMAL